MHALSARVRQEGNPLIDGHTVTFLWEGNKAPSLIDDLHGWEAHPQELKRISSELWAITFDLAPDAYLEYAFYFPKTKKRTPDPFNRKAIYNGVGGHNHFVYMPEAQPTSLTRVRPGVPRGTVTRHELPARFVTAGNKRTVHLYRPAVKEACALLVVYDGQDYLRRGRITQIVDNLIAAGETRPLALALVHSSGKARMVEYGCSASTLAFVAGSVLPLAKDRLNLLDVGKQPGAFGVLGASMGGLMAVYTSLQLPEIFGSALSQAGAFELWEHPSPVMQMAEHFPRPPVKLWLDCGRMDFLLEPNRRMYSLLKEKGYTVSYRENGGAHNYTTWRNSLVHGLKTLFGAGQ